MPISRNRWLILGLSSIVLGYLLLSAMASLVLAPILLVLGYCVFLPLHLWVYYRRDAASEEKSEESDEEKTEKSDVQPVVDRFKEILGDRVIDVRVSERLVDSPACLV